MSDSKSRSEQLSAVYDKYSDMLFRLALAQLGCREDAMDAVHDVYLKYYDIRKDFNDSEHERAWFIRSTVNRCHDIQRHKKISLHDSLEDIHAVASDESESETLRQINRALAAIPEKYRVAVTLHYLESFSVEEIASMLRISASGVKMRLSRGREAMKKYIETEEE